MINDALLPVIGSYDECMEYLANEGLLKYFEIGKNLNTGVFDNVTPDYTAAVAPEAEDLCRLHKLIRTRKVFNVLEFGIGYSTLVMADALEKNRRDFFDGKCSTPPPEIRIKEPFVIYSVDASEYWINDFINKFKGNFPYFERIQIFYSECEAGEYNGQICHFYKNIPNVVTDFIYLDGPSPLDVKGSVNGISFAKCVERTVMSGDLLKIEPYFLPGTMIITDGRTSNARFLANNFKRNYASIFDEEQDITVFELLESPLGKINRNQINYSLGKGYYERLNRLN